MFDAEANPFEARLPRKIHEAFTTYWSYMPETSVTLTMPSRRAETCAQMVAKEHAVPLVTVVLVIMAYGADLKLDEWPRLVQNKLCAAGARLSDMDLEMMTETDFQKACSILGNEIAPLNPHDASLALVALARNYNRWGFGKN